MYTKHPKSADWSKFQGVLVMFRNREVREYASLKDAVIDVGYTTVMNLTDRGFLSVWKDRVWVPKYTIFTGLTGGGYWRHGEWGCGEFCHFFTTEGIRIPVWKLQEAAENFCPSKQKYYGYWRNRKFKFRQGSVEGIRCYRGGGHYYRRVKTHRELTENDFLNNYDEDALEYNIKARGKRRRGNLPTPWDDIRHSDYYAKSWKNYRKHQWKE